MVYRVRLKNQQGKIVHSAELNAAPNVLIWRGKTYCFSFLHMEDTLCYYEQDSQVLPD